MSLPAPLVQTVLRRLGHWEPPAVSFEGLSKLYEGWCRGVSFDNVRKLVALFSGAEGELPGARPDEFFEAWLEHGPGGTCWPAAGALAALLEACGFSVVRATGSMFDLGEPNHGLCLVELEGRRWLVDPSMLTEQPIPLEPGRYGDHVPVEIEGQPESARIWFTSGSQPELVLCRVLELGVGAERFAERYEASRGQGPFNRLLYFRRNLPDRVVVLRGRTKFVHDVTGLNTWELNEAELTKTLGRFGVSQPLLAQFVSSGALAASLAAEPLPTRPFPELPPSQR